LNDIGKDHPAVLLDVARRWMIDASQEKRALVKHALRSLVKQGNTQALEILGYGEAAAIEIEDVTIHPDEVSKGQTVTIEFTLRSASESMQRVLVDLRVHYVKASGITLPRVFKLRTLQLSHGEKASLRKRLS